MYFENRAHNRLGVKLEKVGVALREKGSDAKDAQVRGKSDGKRRGPLREGKKEEMGFTVDLRDGGATAGFARNIAPGSKDGPH